MEEYDLLIIILIIHYNPYYLITIDNVSLYISWYINYRIFRCERQNGDDI